MSSPVSKKKILPANLNGHLLKVEGTLQNEVKVAVHVLADTRSNVASLGVAEGAVKRASRAISRTSIEATGAAHLNEGLVAGKVDQIFRHLNVHVLEVSRAVGDD